MIPKADNSPLSKAFTGENKKQKKKKQNKTKKKQEEKKSENRKESLVCGCRILPFANGASKISSLASSKRV